MTAPDAGECPHCGKRRWLTRKDARAVHKAIYPGDRMSTYRCGPYWHIGHPYGFERALVPRQHARPDQL